MSEVKKVEGKITLREVMFRDGNSVRDILHNKAIREPALKLHTRIEGLLIPGEAFPAEEFEKALVELKEEFEKRSKEWAILKQYNEIA